MRGRTIGLALMMIVAFNPVPSMGQTPSLGSPSALLDAWVELWGSYDLGVVEDLFVRDQRVTYFPTVPEGLIQGLEAIIEHHRGFGFEAGGAERDQRIWVEDAEVFDFGSTALIGAIWFFGDPQSPDDAMRGPMSLLAVRTADGYRIGHMHFATYDAGSDP